jgi:SAM-dependent methyltransferase
MRNQIVRTARRAHHAAVQALMEPELRRKERASWMRPFSPNERATEYAFAFAEIARTAPESVLDVGPGTSSFPDLLATCLLRVKAIDYVTGYWTSGLFNPHWKVTRGDITDPPDNLKGFDAVTCISTLEHIRDHKAAVAGMLRTLKTGGRIIITTPFTASRGHPNVYDHPDSGYGRGTPYICRVSSQAELDEWCALGAEVEVAELYQAFTGPLWSIGQRVVPLQRADWSGTHQLGCFVLRKGIR